MYKDQRRDTVRISNILVYAYLFWYSQFPNESFLFSNFGDIALYMTFASFLLYCNYVVLFYFSTMTTGCVLLHQNGRGLNTS